MLNFVLNKTYPSYREWFVTVLRGEVDPISLQTRYDAFVRTGLLTRLKRKVISLPEALILIRLVSSAVHLPSMSGDVASMAQTYFLCLQGFK